MTVNESSLLDPDFSDFSPEEEFGGMWHVHRHNSNFGRLHRRHPIAPTPVVASDPQVVMFSGKKRSISTGILLINYMDEMEDDSCEMV
ncbi:hypothetical protein Ccrd_022081 [Cynara cardunculus var. scolymus]|uniref:Uncharacterized protein n=1 Tax=Cynara cardunculus var. scolymus TaxID=59895 RepID=A0A103XZC9_CYNCS|nr:hypothetical protein Ccrd_022081 [Cynara cardunculus var. scolymus]